MIPFRTMTRLAMVVAGLIGLVVLVEIMVFIDGIVRDSSRAGTRFLPLLHAETAALPIHLLPMALTQIRMRETRKLSMRGRSFTKP